MKGDPIRIIEGVPYYRYLATFTLKDGRRRRRVAWSPGFPWVRNEVARGLDEEFGIDSIRPRSCVIRQTWPVEGGAS